MPEDIIVFSGNPRNAAEEEAANYSKVVIGCGTPQDIIDEISEYSKDARPPEVYSSYSTMPFIYEILVKNGWNKKVKTLVDLWVENDDNVQRAAGHVKRTARAIGRDLVRGFCIFRLKAIERLEWRLPSGLGVDHQPQTVIFIALENLNPDNGFFITLERGQDVCLDSKADVQFPPTGGGLGIYLALNI